MRLSELIDSTNSMGKGRTFSDCLAKELGIIYVGNKEIEYKTRAKDTDSFVEITMFIKAVTQKDRDLHKVSVALKGIPSERYSTDVLVDYIRKNIDRNFLLDFGEADKYFYNKVLDKEMTSKLSNEKIDEKIIQRFESIHKRESDLFEAYEDMFGKGINIKNAREIIRSKQRPIFEAQIKEHKEDLFTKNISYYSEYKKVVEDYNKNRDILTTLNDPKQEQHLQEQQIKKEEDLANNIPQGFIIDMVLRNPRIIEGKVIIPENDNMWVVTDTNITTDLECRVNCSCFTGDTRVQLANGMSLSLKDLENMTDFKVLAYNTETGKYEYARALNCTKRQENARIMKITLADGTSIRVTPSHRFLNSGCEWKQAQELQVGDLLKFNDKYWGYENHEQKTSSSTFIYLDPTQEGDYQFGELRFTHRPFYVGVTTGAFVKIENEKCIEYLNKLADMNEQPLMFKQYYHVDEHVALQLKEKLVNRIGTIEQGSLLVNNPVQVNNNYINEDDDCIAIVEIEELQEREDVYCLTVEGLGNFAIQTNKGNIIVENCADYEYTYAWYNFEHKAHLFTRTRPPRYYNKDIIIRPERNPRKLPGLCKHLVAVISILLSEGILTGEDTIINRDVKNFTARNIDIIKYESRDIREKVNELEEKLKKYRKEARSQVAKEKENKSKFNVKKFDIDWFWGVDINSNYKVPLKDTQKEYADVLHTEGSVSKEYKSAPNKKMLSLYTVENARREIRRLIKKNKKI